MKISTRPKILASLAAALLVLIAAATILSLVIRHRQKNEINGALAILERNNLPLMKVEQTLGSLFNAEIEFREYTISYDRIHLKKYHEHINHLVTSIDTLQQIAMTFNGEHQGNAIETLREREKQAVNYLRLKRLTDSLMVVALSFDSVSYTHMGDNFYLKKFKPTPGSLSIDTLGYSMTSERRRKGLLGKIKTFLVGEEEKTTSNTKVVVKTGTQAEEPQAEESDSAFNLNLLASRIIDKTNRHYQIQLKKQLEKRNELRTQELKLVKLNNSLIYEIRAILNTFKELSQETRTQYQIRSSRTIARSSTILQRTLLAIILISFPLAVFTIMMLRRNQIYQQRILESKQQALYQAEEKSRFLSYMSHEFRTPLSSVIGFAEQLEQTPMNHDQKNYLSGLMSSSEMLLATVNDILDLSKLDAGKMSFLSNPFRPDETIHQVMKSFRKMASDKSIELSYKHQGNVLTLLGDEIRLKQVLNNLVSNAIKYTPKGKVEIVSHIIENKLNAELKVEVTDTGIGIDAEKIGKIFDEYSRVHSETPEKWIIGTGLGLAVTRKLVDQMGGQVTVSSKKGKGSVFSISIPYPVSKIQQLASVNRKKEASLPDGNIRILVADDNYFNVVLLQSIFKRENIVVDVAENGVDALEKLVSEKYNILLSDMYMPQMDGLELTRQIRQNASSELSRLPVIMLTGNISPEAGEQMGTAGVSDFLIKPFQRKDLIEMVSKHLS
ncbi:MAG: response regulator [Bacteroidales bacterium]|nr:response regulator [Bacteroidales bacterium]